jgi:hypothetical protein
VEGGQFRPYNLEVATRQCFHCKAIVEVGAPHDCWTTPESALTRELSEELRTA